MSQSTVSKNGCPVCTTKVQSLQEAAQALDPVANKTTIGQYFRTNDPLNSIEVPPLKYALESLHRLRAELDADMRTIQAACEKILSTMHHIDLSIRRIRAISHPVRSLPDDILLEIFQWCIPWSSPTKTNHTFPTTHDSLCPSFPTWTFSRVCRRWRKLVISSPRLWSEVGLPLPQYQKKARGRVLSRLALQLQRSSPCDLNVKIMDHDDRRAYRQPCPDDHNILSVLRAETGRFRMFFSSESPNIPKTFSGCPFGRLVSVDLQLNEEVTSFTIDVFRDARSLSSFKQSGGRNVDVIIPTQQLRFYDMGHGPIGRLSGLLAVEELNLRRAHFMKQELAKDSLISASSPLVLPSLRAVSISEYEEGEPEVGFARFIFERINTPALTTLELDLLSEPAQLPTLCNPEALTSLILSFGEPAFEFSDLLSLLRKTPNLVFLSLYDDWKTLPGVELLKALWADASAPTLVPKLTTLELELHVLDEHYPMIVGMLGSRCVRHISRGDVAWCVFTSVTQAVTEICDAAWESFRGKHTAGELGWSDAQMDILNSRPLLLHRYDM